MADSQPWLKTLRRFGSRLSLHGSRRSSLSADSDRGVWMARYENRLSAEAEAYSTSVELLLVTRREDNGLENHDNYVPAEPDSAERRKSEADREDRLALCHDQHPLSLAVATPDPESIRRRPLPPLPPAERTDDGRLKALSAQLAHLSHQGWYWGPVTLEETQIILADLPDGSYIVRDSHNEAYLLAIGLRADGRTVHTRISHCSGRFMFSHNRNGSASSVEELIRRGVFVRGRHHPLPYPVSRLMRMRSLKEYCRFALRRLIAIDRIDSLEIPVTLKSWLKENPY